MKKQISDEEYYGNLPKKHVGAGVFIFNKNHQLLIIKPSYKEGWSIPGGGVDPDESPKAAALRETKEEIGLDLKDVILIGVGYTLAMGIKPETVQLIFYGGELGSDEVNEISLDKSEHSESRFVEISEARILLNERQRHWLTFCAELNKNKGIMYMEL